tara:strand:+ start:1772 stop:1987 length:216 start_codon:yes stop_codon:yes gene_type:complete
MPKLKIGQLVIYNNMDDFQHFNNKKIWYGLIVGLEPLMGDPIIKWNNLPETWKEDPADLLVVSDVAEFKNV